MPIILSPKREKRKRRITISRKTYSILGTVFIGLAGLAFLIFGSGVFKIENIVIDGAHNSDMPAISKVIDSYLDQGNFVKKRNNIYLANLKKLREEILEEVPKVEDVAIERKAFKGILVHILEKQAKGIYCVDTCYYFDASGVAYEPAPATKGFLVFNITDQRDVSVSTGDTVLAESFINSMFRADELFEEILDLSIEGYTIPSNSFDEFRARTEEGWSVYMITDDVRRQIEDLKLFLDSQFEGSRNTLIYADTRLGDRVYYKEK